MEFQGSEFAVNVGDDFLNVFHSLYSEVAVVKGEFLYLRMDPQPHGKFLHTLIPYRIIVNSELDHIALVIHEHLGQELTPQGGDLVVHQIQKLNGVDFFDIVADGPDAFILEIDFPEANFFKVRVLQICEGLHERADLEGPELLPELELNKDKGTV